MEHGRAAGGRAVGAPETAAARQGAVVGIGSRRGVSAAAVGALLERLRVEHDLPPAAVRAYAGLDRRAAEPGILTAIAPAPLRTYPAAVLARVAVANPSERVRALAGTASVAEAAALYAATELARGEPVELVVPKLSGQGVTVAAARIGARPGPARAGRDAC